MAFSSFTPELDAIRWPRDMRTNCATEVCCYHSTHNYPERAFVAAFISALQQQCATLSCVLSISTHQNVGGQVVNTILTALFPEEVSATLASVKWPNPDFIAPVVHVMQIQAMGTNRAGSVQQNSRA